MARCVTKAGNTIVYNMPIVTFSHRHSYGIDKKGYTTYTANLKCDFVVSNVTTL